MRKISIYGLLPLFLPLAGGAWGATRADWSSAVSGSWGDETKWANGVAPQNDKPQGTTYDAVIAAAGPAYTVDIDARVGGSLTVDSITVNSSSATLSVTGGERVTAGLIDVQAGTLAFGGKSLTGARIQGAGTVTIGNATITGITLAATITAGGGLESSGPLAFDGGTLVLGASGGYVKFVSGDSSLTGNGTIVFNGATYSQSGSLSELAGPTLTIGSGITATTGTGDVILDTQNGSLLTNNGTLVLTSGHYAFLRSELQNNGLVQINGGTLVIGAAQTLSGLGAFTKGGGTIVVNGILTVGGGSLDVDSDLGGSARLAGNTDATIITASAGSALYLGGPLLSVGQLSSGYSNGFTSTTGVSVSTDLISDFNARGTITFGSALTLNNHSIYIHEGQALSFTGGIIGGTGAIVVNNPGHDQSLVAALATPDGSTLTIGSGIVVRNDSAYTRTHMAIGNNSSSFDNRGLIWSQAADSTVQLFGVNWKNEGTIQLSNGTLQLWGSTTTANMGLIVRSGGRLEARSLALDNRGAIFTLDAARGAWNFYDGTITGGTIAGQGGAIAFFNSFGGPTIDGVTMSGDFSTSSFAVVAVNGLTLDNATIYQPVSMTFTGTQTLGGTGTFWFTSQNFSSTGALANLGALTIGPGVTARVFTGDGRVGTANAGSTLVNEGTLLVDKNLFQLAVLGASVTNQGTIAASNGGILTVSNLVNEGTLSVNGSTAYITGAWSNSGTISAENSTVTIGGPFTNSGAVSLLNTTLVLAYYDEGQQLGNFTHSGQTIFAAAVHDFAAPLDLGNTAFGAVDVGDGASFTHMTITSSAGPIHVLPGVGVTMNATVAGSMTIGTGSTVSGDIVLQNATISLAGGSPLTRIVTSSLTGTGVVRFDGTANGTINASSATLTVGSGVTIATGTAGGLIGSVTNLVNAGTLTAGTSGQTLTVSGSSATNSGTLEALNGGTLVVSFSGHLTNSGTIHAGVGSGVTLNDMEDTPAAVTAVDIQSTAAVGLVKAARGVVDGELLLDFLGTPKIGDVYTVLTMQSPYTGMFESVVAESLPDTMGVTVQYKPNGVTATVVAVPEPGTLGVLGLGAGLWSLRRRRR
jgi:hypothetical protein